MPKMMKVLLFLLLFLGFASITATTASATTASAAIQVTLTKDDAKTAVTTFNASTITVRNAADQTLISDSDYSLDLSGAASGIYKLTGLSEKQTYQITFCATSIAGVTVSVPITSLSSTPKQVKVKFIDRASYDAKKVGVIGGLAVTTGGAIQSSATVKAVSGTTTYSTMTDANGMYKLYVPIGKYTVIVVGKDTTTDFKNLSATVTAVASLISGPIDELCTNTLWNSGENTLGLTVNEISGTSKIITGVANAGASITAFSYDSITERLTYLASTTAAKAISPATTGTYRISLPDYQPGKRIVIRAKDIAENVYDNINCKTTPVALNSITLTADSSEATIIKPIDITFADSSGTALNAYLKSKITSVVVTYVTTTTQSITLTPTTQYKIVGNKITITAAVLNVARNYTIKVNADGYNQGSVAQTIGPSITTPPTSISGIFTVKTGGGTATGSAQFTSIGTAGTGNSLVYLVSTQSAIQVKLGNPLEGGTALVATTDIPGLDIASTKYIHVYEISSTNAVVKAKAFTLTAAQIKTATNGTTPQTPQTAAISLPAIGGITPPVIDEAPVTTATETAQYTATVTWSGAPTYFGPRTAYTATITITPKTGYTLQGVASNFFTVAGAVATNASNSGVISAVFPATPGGTISTSSTIASGDTNPIITINLANDTFTDYAGVKGFWSVAGEGLNLESAFLMSATQVQLAIASTVVPGTITIQSQAWACTSGLVSNTIRIDIPVSKTALTAAINQYLSSRSPVTYRLVQGSYTPISWSNFTNVMAATLAIEADPGVSQGQVDAAITDLTTARNGLVQRMRITASPTRSFTESMDNVGMPLPGGTDSSASLVCWVAGVADRFVFVVDDLPGQSSTITIDGTPYTSGNPYTVLDIPEDTMYKIITIIVTTTISGQPDEVRTFRVMVSW